MFVLGSAYLDPNKQLQSIGARSVTLQRKPYQVLLWLIENRHRMVYCEEMLERFWDGQEVYDQSLIKAVRSIRKALGEEGGSEFIVTRWGPGYRYGANLGTGKPGDLRYQKLLRNGGGIYWQPPF